MPNLASDILTGLLVSALAFSLGAAYVRLKTGRRFRHLEAFIPADRRVQIVLPSTRITEFEIKGEAGKRARQPPNVLMMPLPEGSAVARLIIALRSLPQKVTIYLTTDDEVSRDYGLTISIGGPSVNERTHILLKEHPNFRIQYPEHVATYDHAVYDPVRDEEGALQEDYGFLFIRRFDTATNIVCCGVWGSGTEAAVRALLERPTPELQAHTRKQNALFMAYKIRITRLVGSAPELLHSDNGRQFVSWR